MARALVLYDEDCGFCRWSLALVLRWDRARRLRPIGLRTPEAGAELTGMDEATRMGSWHLATDGAVYSAGAAVAPLFDLLPGGRPIAALARRFPAATNRGYRWIAGHRSMLAKPLSADAVERATERIAAHAQPFRLAGRASNVEDLGDGSVLRHGGRPAREAALMERARAHGYPVPAVLEVREDALVLERISGPTMAGDLLRRPWRIARHAATLATLHARLHEIPFEGERLLHLDLHPENVLLSPAGPVVIDWTTARAGDPAVDVAMTWVILATSAGLPGRGFAQFFLRHVDRRAARRALPEAGAVRIADPHVTDEERERVRRLVSGCGERA